MACKYFDVIDQQSHAHVQEYIACKQNEKRVTIQLAKEHLLELTATPLILKSKFFSISAIKDQEVIEFLICTDDLNITMSNLGLDNLPEKDEGLIFLINAYFTQFFDNFFLFDIKSCERSSIHDVYYKLSNDKGISLYFKSDELQKFFFYLKDIIVNVDSVHRTYDLSFLPTTSVRSCIGKLCITEDEFLKLDIGDLIRVEPIETLSEVVFDGKRYTTNGGELTQTKITSEVPEVFVFGEPFDISYKRLETMFGNVPNEFNELSVVLFNSQIQKKRIGRLRNFLNKRYIELVQ